MKKSILLSLFAAAIAVLIFNSNSSGPASTNNGNRTGGPGSLSTCASCHSGGAPGTNMTVTLTKKSDNQPAGAEYHPGATYVVKLSGSHPSLNRFGFQMMALNAADAQAGSFSNFSTDMHSKVQNNIELVEHHHPIPGAGNSFDLSFDWTAPEVGAGTVTFYGAVNAVNNDANTSGDATSAPYSVSFAESPVGIATVHRLKQMRVFPNPAADLLHIELPHGQVGQYIVSILSVEGRVLSKQTVSLHQDQLLVSVSDLPQGCYYANITGATGQKTVPFIKQ